MSVFTITQDKWPKLPVAAAGVALTVIRKIEQGKTNLNVEKVNQVLAMFGHELGPVSIQKSLKSGDS